MNKHQMTNDDNILLTSELRFAPQAGVAWATIKKYAHYGSSIPSLSVKREVVHNNTKYNKNAEDG